MANDDIGDRGQYLFCALMTNYCGRDRPWFRPLFLGDKKSTFDYLVELIDHPNHFFFVQVKATRLGYTNDPVRLKVQIAQRDVDRMVVQPAPSYVVGIDATANDVGFLLSVNEARGRIASLSTRHRIDATVLHNLHDEVHAYWSSRDMTLTGSLFQE